MLRALLHTNYVKLSLVPRLFVKAFERVWPVTIVDMIHLGPCLRKNERSRSAGYRYCFVPKCELEATQFAFVCPCMPHLHEQVSAVL